MSTLAQDFGIFDVALAKRCRAVDVPIPYRGYWARKAAGQEPPKTPLPKYRSRPNNGATQASKPTATAPPKAIERTSPEPTVPFTMPEQRKEPDKPSLSPEEAALRTQIEAIDTTVAPDLSNATATIKRTAIKLRAAKMSDFAWARGERSGPVLRINVQKALETRALRIADALLRAAADLGWRFVADPKEEPERHSRWARPDTPVPNIGRLLVLDEPFRISIDEAHRQVPHVLTDLERKQKQLGHEPHSPPWDLAPSGQLRLHLTTTDNHAFMTLRDTPTKPFQIKLRAALHSLLDRAYQEKREREERRLREEAAQERRRQEQILSGRRQAQSKLIDELERQAGAWLRARFLRRYVLAARRALAGERIEVKLQNQSVDFLDWATAYVDQLDSLSPTPSNPDQQRESSSYWKAEEESLKNLLFRLFVAAGSCPGNSRPSTLTRATMHPRRVNSRTTE
jgi:hypothetical protein